ncbi:hypothetical protein CRYUN_Cryun05aG0048700 [Craigia yunnanensis]
MVVNTLLSLMAYGYSPEKLSIYLSDDGGSDLTFYAMLEAATFSKKWLPFCKKFKVESPEAYFRTASEVNQFSFLHQPSASEPSVSPATDPVKAKEWLSVKMILIDGRDPDAVDIEGKPPPTFITF